MSPIESLNTERGHAKLCPIADFQVRLASNDMVIVILQYVETIEQFDSGQSKQLQTVISAQRALELAATLKKAAKLLLEPDSATVLN